MSILFTDFCEVESHKYLDHGLELPKQGPSRDRSDPLLIHRPRREVFKNPRLAPFNKYLVFDVRPHDHDVPHEIGPNTHKSESENNPCYPSRPVGPIRAALQGDDGFLRCVDDGELFLPLEVHPLRETGADEFDESPKSEV